jgi:hypothetical protein
VPVAAHRSSKFLRAKIPLIAAEATTFVLIQKVAKNQVSRNASLPHWAFALQIRQNLGCNLFTLASPLIAHASVKICYALPHTRPPSFCLISPEALLLTKRGPGCFACGRKDLFVLIFCFFCIKTKEIGLRAYERLHAIFTPNIFALYGRGFFITSSVL